MTSLTGALTGGSSTGAVADLVGGLTAAEPEPAAGPASPDVAAAAPAAAAADPAAPSSTIDPTAAAATSAQPEPTAAALPNPTEPYAAEPAPTEAVAATSVPTYSTSAAPVSTEPIAAAPAPTEAVATAAAQPDPTAAASVPAKPVLPPELASFLKNNPFGYLGLPPFLRPGGPPPPPPPPFGAVPAPGGVPAPGVGGPPPDIRGLANLAPGSRAPPSIVSQLSFKGLKPAGLLPTLEADAAAAAAGGRCRRDAAAVDGPALQSAEPRTAQHRRRRLAVD